MATAVASRAVTRTKQQRVPAADLVLPSKITPPVLPDWRVARPRIETRIAEGARAGFALITGPPGAGKTTAIASWAATDPGPSPIAWVRLDEYDNQPTAFWSCLVAALRRAGVAVPGVPAARGRRDTADHESLLRISAALATQDPPVVLVLDDLHLLTAAGPLEGLAYVLRHARPGLRLIAASRMDPLLPLHLYRLAGELTEIRAADLAFTAEEAASLMGQHAITLPTGSLEWLTERTEGWAAGLRLAAISLGACDDPERFLTEFAADDGLVTSYLVEEVLNSQSPEVRDMLLSTSILKRVNADIASELAGHEQAAGILPAVAHANAFVQPLGGGWYRYHTLFAEVLRLKLRHEQPDRMASLHRLAARWHERNGSLTDAVWHAAEAGDWQLAASMVIDGLAIGEIIEPRGSQSLADGFRRMPHSEAWVELKPLLVSAALALSVDQHDLSIASLSVAEGILARLPADQEAASRLAAAMIRLAASRRTGDLLAVAAATADAEVLIDRVPGDKLARHPEIRARVLSGRGAVELWSGHFDEAARVLDSGVAAGTGSDGEYERADCLGDLALVEALRGDLCRAATLAARVIAAISTDGPRPPVQFPNPAALVALAWVHLQRNELRAARDRVTQANAALDGRPDKLVSAVACLVAACGGLADGRASVAAQMVVGARHGWSVPPWLEQRLTLVESQACVAAGDIPAAVAAAERAGRDASPEAAVALAYAWAAAGDGTNARLALAPALAAPEEVPERVRLQAWLVDARLSYDSGDRGRGRRSLESALRLGEREQLRLPFAMERGWVGPVLRHDPELARAYRRRFEPALSRDQRPAQLPAPTTIVVVETLTERERQVLGHVSGMLNTAEVATEMYISVNTVKTHLKSIYRKLGATHRGEAVRRARQLELI